ncbi:MAG: hypothetical protein HOK53_04115 [Gammaproteobacteria bacterium]|nr:hypothetical protein [Gammaproteobacteria bacterium]
MKTKKIITDFLVVLMGGIIALSAAATTIQKFTFEEMVELSELILEGEVISVNPFISDELVYTRILLEVHDVLKGDDPGEFLELDFLGGELNGKTVHVSGQDIPFEGEKGFYFIENTSNDSVNPFLGWSQGHFIIVEEDGVRRMRTAGNQPVTDVEPVSSIPPSIKKPLSVVEGNTDIAAGVMTESSPIMIQRALTVEEFKSRITDLIDN